MRSTGLPVARAVIRSFGVIRSLGICIVFPYVLYRSAVWATDRRDDRPVTSAAEGEKLNRRPVFLWKTRAAAQ
jgi:hypothetical protein